MPTRRSKGSPPARRRCCCCCPTVIDIVGPSIFIIESPARDRAFTITTWINGESIIYAGECIGSDREFERYYLSNPLTSLSSIPFFRFFFHVNILPLAFTPLFKPPTGNPPRKMNRWRCFFYSQKISHDFAWCYLDVIYQKQVAGEEIKKKRKQITEGRHFPGCPKKKKQVLQIHRLKVVNRERRCFVYCIPATSTTSTDVGSMLFHWVTLFYSFLFFSGTCPTLVWRRKRAENTGSPGGDKNAAKLWSDDVTLNIWKILKWSVGSFN